MNPRERVKTALAHKTPDQVPLDLGGCGQTGINASPLYRLRKALALPTRAIDICEPFQLLGKVDEDLLHRLGADVVPLWNPVTLMGTSNRLTQAWQMPDGTPAFMADDFAYDVLPDGSTVAYPQGDRSAAPSMRIPRGGFFFDNIDRSPDYDEDELTPREDYADNYGKASPETCRYWAQASKELYEKTDYAIMGVLGGMGLGDAAELPGPFVKKPRGIRAMQDWLAALSAYPAYVHEVFRLQTEVMLQNLVMYREAVGDRIECIFVSGTDFGTQNQTFISSRMFRELFKPYYRKVNDWIHANTPWKTFYHSCGSVYDFIPDFIDMGADILNPVQCSAGGMEPRRLKKEFGNDIVFWGGGVNTQSTLPFGTPGDVYREVTERCEIFSRDGGFVFAAIHNIVGNVPEANLLAMFRALDDFRQKA